VREGGGGWNLLSSEDEHTKTGKQSSKLKCSDGLDYCASDALPPEYW